MKNQQKSDTKNKVTDPKQKIKGFDYFKTINGIEHPIKKIMEHFKQKKKKRQMFMVLMELRNGKYYMATVATREQYFVYDNGTYYIDPDMVRSETFSGHNLLFYHQDSAMPMKLKINISELKKKLSDSNSDVEKAVNPLSLRAFINSQVIEKVLKGAEMIKDLQQIKMMVLINMIITIGLVGVIAKMLGWF